MYGLFIKFNKATISRININKLNSFIFVIFMFLPSLLVPIKILTNSGSSVYISTIILILLSILINYKRFNKNIIYFIILFNIFYLFNIVFKLNDLNYILIRYSNFIKFGFLSFWFASLIKDYKSTYRYFFYCGIINFIIILIVFCLNKYMFNDFYHVGFDYMSFSYFLLPSILIIFEYFLEKNKKYIFIYIPSIILLLIFGARGAFLSLIITSLVLFFNSKWSKKIKYTALIILIFLIIIVSFQLDLILTRLDLILSSIGINSYSVNQYINILQGDLVKASAGRTELYIKSIELIKNKLFFGGGFTYFNENNQLMSYPHNIFLEIGLQFGLIGLLMFFILNIKLIFTYFIINNYHFKVLFIILFVSSFIRLNFSMTFWETTFFWASIGLSLNAQNYNK